MSDQPFDEQDDLGKLNELLEKVTERLFVSVPVFIGTVRMALELHSILLPTFPCEGDNPPNAVNDGDPVEDEGEYVFHVLTAQNADMYLYITFDVDDANGNISGYAQVVNEDDLKDLMDDDLLAREFPELIGDEDGETPYIQDVRHQGYDID